MRLLGNGVQIMHWLKKCVSWFNMDWSVQINVEDARKVIEICKDQEKKNFRLSKILEWACSTLSVEVMENGETMRTGKFFSCLALPKYNMLMNTLLLSWILGVLPFCGVLYSSLGCIASFNVHFLERHTKTVVCSWKILRVDLFKFQATPPFCTGIGTRPEQWKVRINWVDRRLLDASLKRFVFC
jgi:hypothetical protein